VFQPEFQKGWMEALKKDRDTGASWKSIFCQKVRWNGSGVIALFGLGQAKNQIGLKFGLRD
jgi:hypothetical protein